MNAVPDRMTSSQRPDLEVSATDIRTRYRHTSSFRTSAMKTGTILRQRSSSVGRSPIGGEVFLWTGAFVAREVTVIAPLGMTKSERLKYYSELASFLVGLALPNIE